MSLRSKVAHKRFEEDKCAGRIECFIDSLLPDGLNPPTILIEDKWEEIQKKIKSGMSKEEYQKLLLDEYGPVEDRLQKWNSQREEVYTYTYSLDDSGNVRVDKE